MISKQDKKSMTLFARSKTSFFGRGIPYSDPIYIFPIRVLVIDVIDIFWDCATAMP